MTREEYMNIVGMYKDFLREADAMKIELHWGIKSLKEKAQLSEDEAEYLGWLQEVNNGLDKILN